MLLAGKILTLRVITITPHYTYLIFLFLRVSVAARGFFVGSPGGPLNGPGIGVGVRGVFPVG